MTKKLLLVSFIILFGFAADICTAKYSGGDGSEATPYRISDANDMNDIGLHEEDWDSHFVMVNDINLAQFTGTEFNIIGYWVSYSDNNSFTGAFDGNGHTISNFTYQTNGGYIGLFGYVEDPNVEINDLTLIDPNVDAGTGGFVGSLVGHLSCGTVSNCYAEGTSVTGAFCVGGLVGGGNYTGTISNCYATGTVRGTDSEVGGLVGSNGSTILDCYATASVSGKQWAGGLVGMNKGTISNCYAAGTVCGTFRASGGLVGINEHATVWNCYASGPVDGNNYTGGLVGYNSNSTISNCYATGDVNGNDNIGGLVGSNSHSSTITNCYAVGDINGISDVGGLVGHHSSGSYTKCFWDSDINPDVNGIGNTTDPNVIGKSTAEMQTESTFTNAGWDFVSETINGANDIWTINDGNDYPIHVWPLVNFVGWCEVNLKDYSFFARCWMDNMPCSSADLVNSGFIDFKDFAYFADYWLLTGCGTCGGSDLTGDGDVNNPDLLKFTDCWLKTNCQQADLNFSGSIDNKDLAIFTKYWLTGLQ